MGKLIDLTGQRFGRLTVIERAGSDNFGEATWICKCDCGVKKEIRGKDLRSGHTRSCGCLCIEASITRETKHGGKGTRLYNVWKTMKDRCHNQNSKNFEDYGGRGITVCDEWKHDFAAFRDWALANGYAEGLTIDRKDNDKGYSPENCRWATYSQQRKNQRPRRWAKKPKTE